MKERRRLTAGHMFHKGVHQAEVARRLHVTPAAVHGWYHAWKEQGIRGLKSRGQTGFPSRMTDTDRTKLKQAIIQGARKFGYESDLWTLERMGVVMKRVCKKSFSITRTWQIVLNLGFTCQKPERRSTERDEQAIQTWRRTTFPRLKKMGAETPIFAGVSR